MIRKLLLALVMGLIFTTMSIDAQQQHWCGMTQEADAQLIEQTKRAKRLMESPGFSRSQMIRYVPIVYHQIQNANGTGGIAESAIFRSHCAMNAFYLKNNTDIQFYLQEVNLIKNDAAFQDHYNTGASVINANKKSGAINVFIPASANFDPDGIYNVAGYYSPSDDWVVVGGGNMTGSTIYHELGHFLGLPHPFRGWDWEPYDPAVHGKKVGFSSPSGIPNETMDGLNCAQAGDLICDTAPDYNHFGPNWGCSYNGGAEDPNGVLIDPLEQNVMSYFLSCSNKIFTEGQADVMNSDLDYRFNVGILNEVTNVNISNLTTPALTTPIMEEVVADNNAINFEWDAVPGAEYYEFVLDFDGSFGALPQHLKVYDNKLSFDGSDLFPNKKYFWRVKPRNDQDFCASWSEKETFTTTELTTDVESVQQLGKITIFPNPVGQDGLIFIENTVASGIDKIAVLNANGNLLAIPEMNSSLKGIQIQMSAIPAGIYFLQIETNDGGQYFEKFVKL